MPYYKVSDINEGTDYLVKAVSQEQARRHIAANCFAVSRVGTDEVVNLLSNGVEIEEAVDQEGRGRPRKDAA